MKNKQLFLKNRKIRIIAGKWKGRVIFVTNQSIVRPTISRIRETLFNWLNPVIFGAICLDCFAGSGALGLEALSRGANKVTFVEKNLICITSLIRSIQSFKNNQNQSEVIKSDCRHWLKQSNNVYDVIFIDPPYCDHCVILEVIWLLEQYHHFKKQSWIYIELSKNNDSFNLYSLPKNWFLYRKKSTRSISIYLYCRNY